MEIEKAGVMPAFFIRASARLAPEDTFERFKKNFEVRNFSS